MKMVDFEHKLEIMQEEERDRREEPMRVWIKLNKTSLECDFLDEKVAPEDRPLDDDTPDFMDEHEDDFNEFCEKRFMEVEE